MYNIISSLLRYIFITIIYLFIYSIIKLIYSDIKSISSSSNPPPLPKTPYLRDSKRNNIYPLDKKNVSVGRGGNCDIKIYSLTVSEKHIRLWFEANEWHIEDLGSKNGTFLNGDKIDEVYLLDDGDCIEIGEIALEFCLNSK